MNMLNCGNVDLPRAFDSLDTDHLCTKLEFYGVKKLN